MTHLDIHSASADEMKKAFNIPKSNAKKISILQSIINKKLEGL